MDRALKRMYENARTSMSNPINITALEWFSEAISRLDVSYADIRLDARARLLEVWS